MNPAVMLIDPKYPHNIGSIVRACHVFDVETLRWTGTRCDPKEMGFGQGSKPAKQRLPREERLKDYQRIDWQMIDNRAAIDFLAPRTPVCVEITDTATRLTAFVHPRDAVYVFGPEDGDVPAWARSLCHHVVRIPSANRVPLNLAAAVNITLYDRFTFFERLDAPRKEISSGIPSTSTWE